MLREDDVLSRTTEPRYKLGGSTENNKALLFFSGKETTETRRYKLGESTENNKALLFFSGKETTETFNGSI